MLSGCADPSDGVTSSSDNKSSKESYVTSESDLPSFPAVKVGEIIKFGKYEQDNNAENGQEEIEWQVLEVKEGKALVVSKFAIDNRMYNDEYEDVSWETCDLRSWLNSEFVSNALDTSCLEKILTIGDAAEEVTEFSNTKQDKVFLLTLSYVNSCFVSDAEKTCVATEYAKSRGAMTSVQAETLGNCWWWLSTSGEIASNAVFVDTLGFANTYGFGVMTNYAAVRPAMWIRVEE